MSETKNTEEKLWFKRGMFGWGWIPATVEGWGAVFIYLALLVADFRFIQLSRHYMDDTLIHFAPRFVFLSLVLIATCYFKGEKPEWSWGGGATGAAETKTDIGV
ncbi:MAG TPA: hypothetical protein VJH06_03210 [Candidatus Paceibacterota bacterium]